MSIELIKSIINATEIPAGKKIPAKKLTQVLHASNKKLAAHVRLAKYLKKKLAANVKKFHRP